jgi:hypothetical protein
MRRAERIGVSSFRSAWGDSTGGASAPVRAICALPAPPMIIPIAAIAAAALHLRVHFFSCIDFLFLP